MQEYDLKGKKGVEWWLQQSSIERNNSFGFINNHHNMESVLERFQFNEKAYIDSLNLSEMKTSMINMLKKSLKTIQKIE